MNLTTIHILYLFIGVGYRPKPPDANVESTLITFKHAEVESAGTWSGWVKRLNDFIERKNTNEFHENILIKFYHLNISIRILLKFYVKLYILYIHLMFYIQNTGGTKLSFY